MRQIIVRISAIFLSGISTIYSANILLDGLGASQFVVYAFAINIPNLLPFANLGVSTSLINNASPNSFAKSTRFSYLEVLSQSFNLLIISSISILSLSLVASLTGTFNYFFEIPNYNNLLIILPILLLIALAIPISIGFFILQAEKRSTEALIIGYVTPLVTFFGAILSVKYDGIHSYWGLWLPTFGYLLACLIAFQRSNAYVKLRLARGQYRDCSKKEVSNYILMSGFPNLILNSSILVSIHLPRLFFLNSAFEKEALNYSLFVLYLYPIYNLISAYSLWAAPIIRDISQPNQRLLFIKKSIFDIIPFLIIVSLALILMSYFRTPNTYLDIFPVPSGNISFFILPLTILHTLVVFYYSSITNIKNMKIISLYFLAPCLSMNIFNLIIVKLGHGSLIYPILILFGIFAAYLSFSEFTKESRS